MQLERFVPPSFDAVQPGAKAKPFALKSFGPEKKIEPPAPPPPPTFSEAELKAAEAAGYRKGYVEGELEGKKLAESELAKLDRQIESGLTPLAEQMKTLFSAYNSFTREQAAMAPQLAWTLAQKIAGDALAQDSLALVEPLVKECITRILGEPLITVTVHESIAPRLEEKLKRYFEHSSEPGDITIHGDANMQPADCIVTWAHGNAKLTQAERLKDISRIVDEITAHQTHQHQDLSINQGGSQ